MKFELRKVKIVRENTQLYDLYIDGKATKVEFVDEENGPANLGDPGLSLYNQIKKATCYDLPENIRMDLYFKDSSPFKAHYGKINFIDLGRNHDIFETGIDISFNFEDVAQSNINPLKLIHGALQFAESMGFEKEREHDYYGRDEDQEWYNIFSATFHYRTACNNKTLEQKAEEAVALFNKLLEKVAAEMIEEINAGNKQRE